MTSNTESVILRRSPFLSPLRVEDIFDEVDKIPPDLPFLELSTLHCRLEERVRSTVTLAQLNSLFNCNAPSLVKVYREGLRDYADVTPVHGDGSRDAYISRNGQATRDQLSSRIKWRALLLLCCPIYEKNLWESAEVFNDLTLTTLNSNLGTNAPSRLQALFRAFPDIVLDRSDGEHLIFYPSKKPTNLSKDYIYHLFFKIVRKRKEIRLSELSREMKLHHSVELNVDTV
uniref:RNase H domain-containing protein n=1 Tax=Steinernema glaseri TaxID=37863 RepID=A0A1I7ZR72_9BILA